MNASANVFRAIASGSRSNRAIRAATGLDLVRARSALRALSENHLIVSSGLGRNTVWFIVPGAVEPKSVRRIGGKAHRKKLPEVVETCELARVWPMESKNA